MLHRNSGRLGLVIAVVAVVACSRESPVAPGPTPQGVGPAPSLLARAVPGSYELSFYISGPDGLETVTSMPVLTDELILGAHVEDNAALPAQRGAVTFQYCSFKGLPPNDITRADEAPSASCTDGSATWKNLLTVSVDTSGNAFMDFGLVQIPRTVGFRFRYASQGSGIANGTGAPRDFTWTP